MSCDFEMLEACAQGALPAADRAALDAHLATCADCRTELAWLEKERAVFAQRAAAQKPVSPAVLAAAERRIAPSAPAPRFRAPRWATRKDRIGLVVLGAAAALAFVLLRAPRSPAPGSSGPGNNQPGITAPQPTVAQAPAPTKADLHRARIDEAEHAIDAAETEYEKAATLLEAEYHEGRSRLSPALAKKYDAMLADTKQGLALAKTNAGKDVDARVRILDGYAGYVRSLQHAVYDIPEDRR